MRDIQVFHPFIFDVSILVVRFAQLHQGGGRLVRLRQCG